MNIQVIGLSGKSGTGKDYLFENFIRVNGFHRWALADHFKIATIGRSLATYEEVFYTKPPSVRKSLQRMGTEEGREIYGEDIWLNTAKAWMQHLNINWNIDKFCITDVRFPNEVEFVKNMGGKVIRINAPKRAEANSLSPEARLHISETALDNYTDFDYIIENDPEYASTVPAQIEVILKEIG